MSDSGRDRRRVGDATRQRIDDLADGWKVREGEGGDGAEPAESSPPPLPVAKDASTPGRPRRPSAPPPPRSKRHSAPPPPPRSKRRSAAPPPPPRAKRASDAPAVEIQIDPQNDVLTDRVEKADLDQLLLDSRAPSDSDASVDDLIASVAESAVGPPVRDEDPTVFEQPKRSRGTTGGLRRPQVLPKKRGLMGDVGYVVRALFKVTEARRELAQINRQLDEERAARDQRLISIARQTIADPDVQLAMVERSRDELASIEEGRSLRAGASAAAEAEITALERARATESQDKHAKVKELEAEIEVIAERLVPLEKDANKARNEAATLHDTLASLDRQITSLRSSLVTVKGPKTDPTAVEAEIASLRAEREAVSRDQPAVEETLVALEPEIAKLTESRQAAEKEIVEIRRGEDEAERRHAEELEAIRARKAVEDRAVASSDRERDEALLRLGEDLTVERPEVLSGRLRAVDEHDLSIATLERRALELSELVGGIDRGAILRGGLIILLVTSGVVALILWLALR